MADFLIDFEWWRDPKGYKLVDAEAAKPGEPWTHSMHPEWGLLEPQAVMGTPEKPPRVVGRSGRLEPIKPLDSPRNLFVTFANIATKQAVLSFVQRYGPLTQDGLAERGQPIPEAIEHAKRMRDFVVADAGTDQIADLIGPEGIPLSIGVSVIFDRKTKMPRLRHSPRSLLHALWMQMAFTLSGGVVARECPLCGDVFPAGARAGRRRDAEFCSHDHQILFNSHKRSQGR